MNNQYDHPQHLQQFQPAYAPPVKPPFQPPPPQETNAVGFAGFVVAIVSIFTCGIPVILSLPLCLLGLLKRPRGFAAAGIFISFLGLAELATLGVITYGGFRLVEAGNQIVMELDTKTRMMVEVKKVAESWNANGELPAEVDGQILIDGKQDAYGKPIVYETDGATFTLRSRGPDLQFLSDDDIVAGPFEDVKAALEFVPTLNDASFPEGELGDEIRQKIEEQIQEIRREMEKEHPNFEAEFDIQFD